MGKDVRQELNRAQTIEALTFQQQADAVLSQANPVSATLYEVLATTKNVRIISIAAQINWAITQPTPLEVVVTIDGQTLIFSMANPVTATGYYALPIPYNAEALQSLVAYNDYGNAIFHRSSVLEGRSVKVEVRITWATTQPTPLFCRVKYATRS